MATECSFWQLPQGSCIYPSSSVFHAGVSEDVRLGENVPSTLTFSHEHWRWSLWALPLNLPFCGLRHVWFPCPTITGFFRDGTYLIIHIGNILNRFTPNISGFVLVSSKEMTSIKNSLSWLGSSLICLWFWTSSHDGVRYSAVSISCINSASLALLTRICDVPVMFLNEPRGQDVTVSIKTQTLWSCISVAQRTSHLNFPSTPKHYLTHNFLFREGKASLRRNLSVTPIFH